MRASVYALLGGLLLTAVSVTGFVGAFMPITRQPEQFAVQVDLECPSMGKSVAAIHLIPEPPEYFESLSYLNVAIDHKLGCALMLLKVHKSLNVHILNSRMVRETAKTPNPSSHGLEDIDLVKTWQLEANDFKSYKIDLAKLGADRWLGISPIIAGRRSSFDTYDYEAALQLSEGNWTAELIPVGGTQLASGERSTTLSVPSVNAGRKVYYIRHSIKVDSLSGLRELALILLSVALGTGLTTTAGAAWRLITDRRTDRRLKG